MSKKTDTQTDAAQVDPSEGVESLDKIAAEAQAFDLAPVTAQAQAQALTDEATDKAAAVEIAAALVLLRAAAVPLAPEHVQHPLELVWSEAQLEQIAAAFVDVARLNGWTVSEVFDRYGPYLRLAGALGVPALVTLKLLKTPAPKTQDGQP